MKTYLLTVFIGLSLIGIAYSCRSAESILDYPVSLKKQIGVLLPQGWAFFTKSARDPIFSMYKINEKGDPTKISISNVDNKNLYGISRFSRRISFESSFILNAVARDKWQQVKGFSLPNISDIPVSYVFNENKSVKQIGNGRYLLIYFAKKTLFHGLGIVVLIRKILEENMYW